MGQWVVEQLSVYHPAWSLATAVGMLLLATQLVIVILERLEQQKFGAVALGTLFTPLCTGFPNLMLGLFGQERLRDDLVLQLNVGNNIANTSLVTGTLLLLAGPLWIRPGKGKSKQAKKENRDHVVALVFFWLAAGLTVYVSQDGLITRWDGLLLAGCYLTYQCINLGRRGKVARKHRLKWSAWLFMLGLLLLAALLIHLAIELLGQGLDRFGSNILPGWHLGLFLGLLTVIPESLLLLRLAWRKGSLGFSGLIGDCLVSIPLVIGLSALLQPIPTAVIEGVNTTAARPFWSLAITMVAFTWLSFQRRPVRRKVGLIFIGLYAIVWWLSQA